MSAHLIDGEFQSDKYPTCPRGKVPLSVKDKSAQSLLWEYAQRRRSVDAEFSDDLEAALRAAGFDPASDSLTTQLSQALRELGEANADAENARGQLAVAAKMSEMLTSDRDAALRSTAELTRERDRWFMAALGACADSGIPTPANAREEFTPESMASEIRRLAYNLASVTRSTAELRGALEGMLDAVWKAEEIARTALASSSTKET